MPERPVGRMWRWLYRLALHAFPPGFRERWEREMQATFDARTRAAGWPVAAREVWNALCEGNRERVHGRVWTVRMIYAQDIRYALRLLWRSPGFTLLTVLVLAGGLGLSTFTFSFLYTAMWRPLPLGEGARIVRINQGTGGQRGPIDVVDVQAIVAATRTLRNVGGYTGRDVVIGTEGERRVIDATVADPALFSVARTQARLGRVLLKSDAERGAEPVIVLSHRTWEVAFGADRSVVDSYVMLDGVSTRVVGVMPEGFGFPVASEAWLPLPAAIMETTVSGVQSLSLVGRLAPGATHAQAAAEVTPILRRAIAARDTSRLSTSGFVESFPAAQFGEERALVFSVLNAVSALILLLALVNVTNLLLARANERVRETAVRLALGAGSGRLVMQVLWETVLLCFAGGVLGTTGAAWGLAAITRWTQANMEGNLAFWWVWRMDQVTLLGAGAFVTLSITFLGGVVAWRVIRTNVREVLQDGSARSGSRREGRLSRLLIAVQVTTLTVLMFIGVLSGIAARRVLAIDPGYDVTRMLHGGVIPPEGRYATWRERGDLLRQLEARLAAEGETERVLLRTTLAEQGTRDGAFVVRDARATGARPSAHVHATLGDLSTVGIRIVEGRALTPLDDRERTAVALVSRSLADRLWPGRSPVGLQLRLTGTGDTLTWRTIVGVTSNVLMGNPLSRQRSSDAIHVPLQQEDVHFAAVLLRYRSTEVAGRVALQQAFVGIDPLLVPDGVQPMARVLERAGIITRAVSRLFAACFAFALVLALVGTYGLMSRSIGLRRREIGVRRALGASAANVTTLLLRQGTAQVGIGAVVAAPLLLTIGVGFARFFPVGAWLTLLVGAGVSVAIVATVVAATWIPTRRVVRVPPRDALRAE